ncbi:MAG: hypothetical protein GKR98_06240 [Boseongicola sp.]|nr:MAG: hypothetical protein GKR98_06240 [Boseongicola sp.]
MTTEQETGDPMPSRLYDVLKTCGLGVLVLGLGGCEVLEPLRSVEDRPSEIAVVEGSPEPPANARTVEQFDTTTAAERAAATSTGDGNLLGTVVVSLGDVTQPGFWLQTTLVDRAMPGQVRLGSAGAGVAVELRPISEGSARLSLAAFRLLGVGLTDLPRVQILAN